MIGIRTAFPLFGLALSACATYAPDSLPEGAELIEQDPSVVFVSVWASMLKDDTTLTVVLNDTKVAELEEEQVVAFELIPHQSNSFVFKSSNGESLNRTVSPGEPGSHLYWDVYNPPLGSEVAELELSKVQASAVFAKYPEVKPIVATSDISAYPDSLKAEANACLSGDEVRHCEQVLAKIPERLQAPALTSKLLAMQESQDRRKQAVVAMEASLPPEVLRDKYMVSLSTFLKEQRYQEALGVFAKLDGLNVDKDPSLDFFYGEALLKTGQPQAAMERLYRYIGEQGSGARHYSTALDLVNQAESEL